MLAVTLLLRPWLFAVCHDEEYARVSGMPVRALNLTLAIAAAVTVTAAMRTVGLLLVSALMVIPVATAQRVSRGFTATMAGAMALGVLASAGGLWASWRSTARRARRSCWWRSPASWRVDRCGAGLRSGSLRRRDRSRRRRIRRRLCSTGDRRGCGAIR